MFIRWRQENARLEARSRWYAYLAESVRVEGKPRQKIITYLGSIEQRGLTNGAGFTWKDFWFKVHCSLSQAKVSREVYKATVTMLSKRVRVPEGDEWTHILKEGYEEAGYSIERRIADGERAKDKRSDIEKVMSLNEFYLN